MNSPAAISTAPSTEFWATTNLEKEVQKEVLDLRACGLVQAPVPGRRRSRGFGDGVVPKAVPVASPPTRRPSLTETGLRRFTVPQKSTYARSGTDQ
eukprot:Skav219530  [mRNA]  locus=scaffold30:551498:552995:- [translate_table: standard]